MDPWIIAYLAYFGFGYGAVATRLALGYRTLELSRLSLATPLISIFFLYMGGVFS